MLNKLGSNRWWFMMYPLLISLRLQILRKGIRIGPELNLEFQYTAAKKGRTAVYSILCGTFRRTIRRRSTTSSQKLMITTMSDFNATTIFCTFTAQTPKSPRPFIGDRPWKLAHVSHEPRRRLRRYIYICFGCFSPEKLDSYLDPHIYHKHIQKTKYISGETTK